LQQLIIEGGTALAVFVRCFVDKKGMEMELKRRLYVEFPQWALATISVKFHIHMLLPHDIYVASFCL